MSHSDTSSPEQIGNPVIPLYAADPHAELYGDRFYIYATNAGVYSSAQNFQEQAPNEKHGFAAWSSTDLKHWKSEGTILEFANIPWAKDLGDAWAPCMAERNGRYYFYFCAASRIGVAVGDSPTGPFHDVLGQPLVDFREDLSAIDPMVFIDDDGEAYFYWGAVPGYWLEGRGFEIRTHLSVRRLNSDMVSFASEEITTIHTQQSPGGWHSLDHIEASHVVKRNGIYYFMWSPGGFASNDDSQAYRVHYATSSSPLGPWTLAQNNPVLATRREVGVVGPGHHSTLQIPGTDHWYCVYHCHKGDADRRVFIDRMSFDDDGTIQTIVPTLEGPPMQSVTLELRVERPGPYQAGDSLRLEARNLTAQPWTRVEFFSHATCIGQTSDEESSLDEASSFLWPDLPRGFHRLTARATFGSGAVSCSAPLNIDVF